MERLVRLATALHHAGRVGASSEKLIQVAGFEGDGDPTSALTREFKHLRNLGWAIENIGAKGESGRYRMTTVDNRLRLRLDPAQQEALRRAVLLADRGDLADRLGLGQDEQPPDIAAAVPTSGHGEDLSTVVNAVRMRRLLRFRYKGSDRVAHPVSVKTQHGKWYLGGREAGSDAVKWFVVSRMSEVSAHSPGTAEQEPVAQHTGLHPMTWLVDPPVDVTLRTSVDHTADVRRWLNEPQTEEERDGAVEMVYRVTNRAALRCRLYELGPRVEIVGPPEMRHEVLDELAFMAGE